MRILIFLFLVSLTGCRAIGALGVGMREMGNSMSHNNNRYRPSRCVAQKADAAGQQIVTCR